VDLTRERIGVRDDRARAHRLFSPHGRDWTDRMPAITEAMMALPLSSATINGEAVVGG
jgi:ATP-dependent DNA ligase